MGDGHGPAAVVTEGDVSEPEISGTEPDDEPEDAGVTVSEERVETCRTGETACAPPSREEKVDLRLQRMAQLKAEMDQLMAASIRNFQLLVRSPVEKCTA